MNTEVASFGAETIDRAADLIRRGQCVAITTESVYGLAADATSGEAVARIYAAKGRPSFNPLIVHVIDRAQAERLASFDDRAMRLAEAFWPGPLTLVLPTREGSPIASLVTAGLDSIAIRMPAHRAVRALIEAAGVPLAAPSANASGAISPTRAQHVLASLGRRIPLIVDDGPTEHGLESTIVAVDRDSLRLLRPGPITPDQIVSGTGLAIEEDRGCAIRAPGQLSSHYSPAKPLRLNATDHEADEWLIGFGTIKGNAQLSAAADLVEAAARLFDLLHEADSAPRRRIAIAPIPKEGIGAAINDRLQRAAAPKSGT